VHGALGAARYRPQHRRHPSGGFYFVPTSAVASSDATLFGVVRLVSMTHLSYQLAATHDHWLEEPMLGHAIPALQLWWRHFARKHVIFVDVLEWVACGFLAVTLLAAELIANA
jgi:hypothetical protein